MIAIELTAAIDASGTLKTFYVSNDRLVTLPTDTPANQVFEPALRDVSIATSVFQDGKTTGVSRNAPGEIVIDNTGGLFDSWIDYGFDGRPVVIRMGNNDTAYPLAFRTILTATAEKVEISLKTIRIIIRDKMFKLDVPAQPNVYLGDNALPNGFEGVADLKGRRKPKAYGIIRKATCPLVNTSKLMYQLNDGAITSVQEVTDNGVPLSFAANYATAAALQSASVAGGTYATCLAAGYVRLGSMPTAPLFSFTAPNLTASAIFRAVAVLAGLSDSEISSADLAALAILNSEPLGVYLAGDESAIEAMDQIAASVGVGYAFDPFGVLRFSRIDAPNVGNAVAAFDPSVILREFDRRAAGDNDIPVYRTIVNYSKYYTTPSSFAGSVPMASRNDWSKEYRVEYAIDTSIRSKYLSAGVLEVSTLFTSQSAGAAEAVRLLNLYKVRRDVLTFSVSLSVLGASFISLLSDVLVTYNRFGMDAGKAFKLIGLQINLTSKRATLTVWG